MRVRVANSPVLAAGLLAIAAGCSPDAPGGGDDIGMSSCETGWVQSDGADYGDPWEPPLADDLPDVKLDIAGVLSDDVQIDINDAVPEFDGDVVDWDFDRQTQIFSRRVTLSEVREFGWNDDDVLVIMPGTLDTLQAEKPDLRLSLPLYPPKSKAPPDATPVIALVDLSRSGTFRPAFVIKRDARTQSPRKPRAAFAYYTPSGLGAGTHVVQRGQVLARLVTDHERAIHVRGVGLGRRFTLRGPIARDGLATTPPIDEPIYRLSSGFEGSDMTSFSLMPPLPQAAGTVFDLDDVEQCSDSLDNDGDTVGDSCDYECYAHPDFAGPGSIETILAYENAKSFGIFGDLLYCSAAADYWELDLAALGMETAQFLNWVDGGEPNDNNAFRMVIVGCDVRESIVASACHDDGQCVSDLVDYPLSGVGYNLHKNEGENEPSYVDLAWATGDWYVEFTGRAPPMHAVVIAAQQNDPPGNLGTAGSAYSNRVDADPTKSGAAAVNVNTGFPAGYLRIAHELGHTMGLPHDIAVHIRQGDDVELPGFMNDGGGTQPVLGNPDPDEDWWGRVGGIDTTTSPQIWAGSVSAPLWPRSSGFGHTGCDEDTCDYFPGLTCVNSECRGPVL